MRVVMTLLVRDEADIVAANIEYHLAAGVDVVIATDNRSVDGTSEILRAYQDAGVAEVIDEPGDDYSQARWVTRMARMAAVDHGADWVINNDADEFWWVDDGDLPATLATTSADVWAVAAQRFNFVARPDDDRAFWRRMTVRQTRQTAPPGVDAPNFGPKTCHRAHPEIVVAQGNHDVAVAGDPAFTPLLSDSIEILHFPTRSRARFENKIVLGGAAYARNTELPEGTGKTWRDLYATHQEGDFAAAYDRCVLSPAQIEAGLAAGDLTEDHRLADRLRELSAASVVPGAISDRERPLAVP